MPVLYHYGKDMAEAKGTGKWENFSGEKVYREKREERKKVGSWMLDVAGRDGHMGRRRFDELQADRKRQGLRTVGKSMDKLGRTRMIVNRQGLA